MSIALSPGRFQPFHRGHLLSVQKILRENERIIVGVRDTPLDNDLNIFSVSERGLIIHQTLVKEVDINKVSIIVIDDKTLGMELPHIFDVVYTGNDQIRDLFKPKYLTRYLRSQNYSATEVRKRLKAGGDISGLVHPEMVHLIETIYQRRIERSVNPRLKSNSLELEMRNDK